MFSHGIPTFTNDEQQIKTMADLTFTINRRSGKKAWGTLEWPDKQLTADCVSGASNAEAIPVGVWTAERNKLLDKVGEPPYCDPKGGTGHCWMQALNDQLGRTEMGIHPDGGTADATNGCIGLKVADSKPWYDAFYAVKRGESVTVSVIESLRS